MMIEFAPRNKLTIWLEAGWRLVPGHEYRPADWAILLVLPEVPEPMTAAQIRTTAARFWRTPTGRKNKAAAATSRNIAQARAKYEAGVAAHQERRWAWALSKMVPA